MNPWDFNATFYLTGAALLGYLGTNTQAALAKQRLLDDPDPLIAEAGRLWTPVRWFGIGPARRRRRYEVEAELRADDVRWGRYRRLLRELTAWNQVESSIVLALAGSVYAILASIFK